MTLATNRRRGQKSIVYCDGIKSPRSGGTKPKPSGAGSVWKGGARKRADDVFFCRRHKKTSEQSELCSDVVEEGGFEPPKLTQQIYSLPPLATRELLHIKLSAVLPSLPPEGRPQTRVQRSESRLERRSSAGSKLSRMRGSERSEACDDVELVDGFEPPTC